MSHASSDKSIIQREMAASLALNRGLIEDFNLTWKDDAGRGLMHHAALRNDVKLVEDMIISGLSVHDKDRVRHRACELGWCLRHPCFPVQVGSTPLHLAVLTKDSERIVELLLQEGARIDEPKGVRVDLLAEHRGVFVGA